MGGPDGAAYDVREQYTKYEYRIPMRDGVRLFTSVLVPKDTSTTYPFMLTRTPFGVTPYGPDEDSAYGSQTEALLKAGYILVRQDVRGRLMSEGEFTHVTPHRPDKRPPPTSTRAPTPGTRWTGCSRSRAQPQRPRRHVGDLVFGVLHGWPGSSTRTRRSGQHRRRRRSPTYSSMTTGITAARSCSPTPSIRRRPTSRSQARRGRRRSKCPFDYGTEDGYEFFLGLGPIGNATGHDSARQTRRGSELLAHPTYDEFWQSRAIWRHLEDIGCPVLTVGGWFDAEDLMGPLRVHRAIRGHNPGIATTLVMGPWVHGGWRRTGRRLGTSTSRPTRRRSTSSTSSCRSSSTI